jgi:small subunit ribosomal protein S3e
MNFLLFSIVSFFHHWFSFFCQGVLGIKVKVMLDWDPKGKQGPTMPLPDLVTIHPPKEEDELLRPIIPEIPVA